MKTFFFLLVFQAMLFGAEEGCFGTYFTTQKDCSVRFSISEKGIRNLSVNSLRIIDSTITYDYLGTFGNSQLLQITFTDENGMKNIIKVLIVSNNGSFVIASGFYIRCLFDGKDKMIVREKKAIELSYKDEQK